jgi:hypothetical protein
MPPSVNPKQQLVFHRDNLAGRNAGEGGKNGEKENTNRKGFGFEFWLNGKEKTA